MESESFETYKELVSEVTKGMERVKQLRASFSVNQDPLLDRMVASHEEALSILTGNAPEVQCRSPTSSVPDPPDPSVSKSKVSQSGLYKRRWKSRERVTATYHVDETYGDGYAWRKYGEKTILNSKYPRRYYKCVHRGCPARKHVERSKNDDTYVATYSWKHNCSSSGAIHTQRSEHGEIFKGQAGILPQLGNSQYVKDSQPGDEPVKESLSSKNPSVI